MAITDWPEAERPREKLLAKSATALTDAELLAIFLRTGVKGMSAVDLARLLLQDFGSVSALFKSTLSEFSSRVGLGAAKYAQLMAVKELTSRALAEESKEKDVLTSPDAVRRYLQLAIGDKTNEVFYAVLLDQRHQVIDLQALSVGTVNEAQVYPREVVKLAVTKHASAMIVAHNHPSGSTEPSTSDIDLTSRLKEALQLVDVRLLDHFIVTETKVVSMAELGLFNFSV